MFTLQYYLAAVLLFQRGRHGLFLPRLSPVARLFPQCTPPRFELRFTLLWPKSIPHSLGFVRRQFYVTRVTDPARGVSSLTLEVILTVIALLFNKR